MHFVLESFSISVFASLSKAKRKTGQNVNSFISKKELSENNPFSSHIPGEI